MKKYIQKFIGLFLLVIANVVAFATEPDEETDTLKRDIIQWKYNALHTERTRTVIDTSSDFVHRHDPNGSLSEFKVSVAEYASPTFDLQFSPRKTEVHFLQPHESAMYSAHDLPEFTAQRPYSNIAYSQGLNGEQAANFIHTQNVSKFLNLGFILDFYKTDGEFDNQKISGRHVAPWISYYGQRFLTTFKFAYNRIGRGENGGIVNDSLLNDEKLRRWKFPYAQSDLIHKTAEFEQKWNLGRKPKDDSLSLQIPHYKRAVGVRFEYEASKRYYSDGAITNEGFYSNILYDSLKTTDSLLFKDITCLAYYELQPRFKGDLHRLNFRVAGGQNYQSLYYHDYNYSIPEYFQNNTFYQGSAFYGYADKFVAEHLHRFYALGENKGDFSLKTNATYKGKWITASVNHCYENRNFHSIYRHFESNIYRWHNSFDAEKFNEFGANISVNPIKFNVNVNWYSLGNYVSFGSNGMLQQTAENGNAFSVKVQKTSHFWCIFLQNGFLYQKVNVGMQDYPTWALANTLAVRFAVYRKLIRFNLGLEMLNYAKYNAPVYDGVLGDFLPQTTYKYGNFPIMNVFAVVQYKPVKFFVKYSGLYALLVEQNYMIAGQPQTNGTLSFGVSLMLYN